jgi:rare lipoprotein A (peptidoglycan hydrolase)
MHKLGESINKFGKLIAWNRLLSASFLIIALFVVIVLVKFRDNETAYAEDIGDDYSAVTIYGYDDIINRINTLNIGSSFYYEQEGIASYYGKRFHNRKTANGEIYDMYAFSAAHKKLPFGTILKVTNLETNMSSFVRINDRGPFVRKRIIDLSYNVATEIDGIGLPNVRIEGFLPNKAAELTDSSNSYMLAYSLDKPLACLPITSVVIMDSTSDFCEAVEKYEEFSKNNPYDFAYLMVPTTYDKSRRKQTDDSRFYIGYFDNGEDVVFPNSFIAKY